ncbi:ribonuclease [Rhizocola hellebori]|uniref:Ribonuclease n=1 Tax=Rhizocola hellebori TaxID=1392758 RepID=A0A8J3VKH0_9ACTN|nr:YihY/virulence factor BrkB family protein [Rhizocola hellebori]GIH09071.1 ribonuclease [Rhizocola hellebori]
MIQRFQTMTERISTRYHRVVNWGRKRSPLFDHFWRAKERYGEVLGGRLSAAIAYYGFFAVFALAMVVYSVLINIVSANPETVSDVDAFLQRYFTTINVDALKANSASLTTIGTISLIFAGIGWVDAWRSSLRAVWRLDQHPGNFLVLRLVDLGTLIVFGLMMAISLGVSNGLERLFEWISGGADQTFWFGAGVLALAFAINLVIAFGLMTVLPRMHLSVRRLLPSVIGIAIGLTLLNWLGRFLITRTERNPAYAIVATSVGLLVYLYIFNQIVIWAAAWAATSSNGRVFDLAWGRPREHDTVDLDEPSGNQPQ